ncbi:MULTISPECIES: DUF3122 domain-containing protein [Prochlorococcus]|uniref:DUF3122 domain-containing protein n=1 Tax=Prochlorococcus marinus (strain SARG / CCMP1375 / SS120) TaxID=167539 RepID=Q7VAW3_PROMA|nr:MULTISPECIES: DUF3122 domain-containing protein [Prochlorococcus]AAQ00384.1 Uncharacterized protein Pro_1340 [Prochlorococcus marinus subsp. marinus str. CCMP1375]KGG14264.1 hypothetical protein EV04_0116 [Prochlorococcus marinus str. LG]KGG22163.1 hypothetical protein EV08_0338 [Prochlorococcus marinus str. SS2]KGG24519.1 hypothetical protein EV09_0150 [Prochlorococcus marinus str. SS35]KGG33414.1 hypothetical protein EV10_0622 [Prochlorococcus marinus str. SS51]
MINLSNQKHIKSIIDFGLVLISCALLLLVASPSEAKLEFFQNENDYEMQRSLESLRDLDYQTWQLVVYPKAENQDELVLRIIGFTGSLRLDHPEKLQVKSGIKSWNLSDITLENPQLFEDNRDAAAEFELGPLLMDLKNDRPLRLSLRDGFNELPVPPYLVNEWRSMKKIHLENGN